MVQGTKSDAGKSGLVAGMGRVLTRPGTSLAPFKLQNMPLNSSVASNGGEIGRAQSLQACAVRVDSHTDINPVLLKPSTDVASQVVVHGQPVPGVIPYLHRLRLDENDVIRTDQGVNRQQPFRVVVPVLPRISNHTDCDVLRLHPEIEMLFVGEGEVIPDADLIILPGSKNVQDDLRWMRSHGWDAEIERHVRYGGTVPGICGGYHMLGECISNPQGIEAGIEALPGLGLLPVSSLLKKGNLTEVVTGYCEALDCEIKCYEIHCGETRCRIPLKSLLELTDGCFDGVMSADESITGTYLHGLFGRPQAGVAILRWAGLLEPRLLDRNALREQGIERLADTLETSFNLSSVFAEW